MSEKFSENSSFPSMLQLIQCNTDIMHRYHLVQKSEAEFIKKVKMKFGQPEDVTILLGDWGGAHMRFHAPTKVKGFRKMFKKAGYDVFLVDEFRTSSLCPMCHDVDQRLETFVRRESPRPYRQHTATVHGLLRCPSDNHQLFLNQFGVSRAVTRKWNRDDVATLNIRYIVNETIASGGIRPPQFSR